MRGGGFTVIRQAISCDICASEKKDTPHWFVAYEKDGELRVGGWSSRYRLRAGSKHLCGQTCLHKLLDEFVAKSLALRAQANAASLAEANKVAAAADTSLTGSAAYEDVASSARLITPVAAKTQTGLVAMPGKMNHETLVPAFDEPHYASRNWRAEAWERERERELRAVECRPDIARRRSTA